MIAYLLFVLSVVLGAVAVFFGVLGGSSLEGGDKKTARISMTIASALTYLALIAASIGGLWL